MTHDDLPAGQQSSEKLGAIRNDVLEEAARVADGVETDFIDLMDRAGITDARAAAHTVAGQIAAAIRALKDASLPDYSGGGS